MTLRELGERIAWSTGDDAALRRMQTITSCEIQHIGLTQRMAVEWYRFYIDIKRLFPRNPSARGRAKLMYHICRELTIAENGEGC